MSPIGMGCARLGAFWQRRSLRDAVRVVRLARELDITLFDTADCYARGLSERVLGHALRHERDAVVLATKIGSLKTPAAIVTASRYAARDAPSRTRRATHAIGDMRGLLPTGRAEVTKCFDSRYIDAAVGKSLRRLGTEHLDILYLHGPSAEDLRIGAFGEAVERLLARGTIRCFGVSCATEEEARLALELPSIACLQVPYNAAADTLLPSIAPIAVARGVALITNQPLDQGQCMHGRRLDERPADVVERALAAPLRSTGVAAVLVGMTRSDHVAENVHAARAALRAAGRD